jgi:hypothetical protein
LREQGVSNPSVQENSIEKFCNKFAAYLLAPDSLISKGLSRYRYAPSTDSRFIRLFSSNLGISQECAVRRLVETGYLTQKDYTQWRSLFNGVTPPSDQSDGSGGGGSDPLQNKRTSYGNLFLYILGQARRQGKLDEIDIYRLSGIKPKYQDPLFEGS